MNNIFDELKNIALFKGIEADELKGLFSCLCAKTVQFEKNHIIFLEGDRVELIGIVLSGNVQIVKEDYYGKRNIITSIGKGEIFAEAFACAGIPEIPVSVISAEDSEIMFLDCKKIINSCSNSCVFHKRLIQNLFKILADRNLLLNQKMEFLLKRTTREKLIAYLSNEAKKSESNTFVIPFDRQGLADYLGVERSAMSTELGKLKKEGILDFHKNKFIFLISNSI